jgi:hypothetical protein
MHQVAVSLLLREIADDVHDSGKFCEWGQVRGFLLAVEVLSPSSVRTDRVTKREFFLRVGVPEY